MPDKQDNQLPTDTAAIWGCFLYEGLMMAEHKLGEEHTLMDYWPEGYIELVTAITEVLPKLWEEACKEPQFQKDHPGVFEYEVVSTLGQYLGEYLTSHDGELPPDKETEAAIKHLVLSFFAQQSLPF